MVHTLVEAKNLMKHFQIKKGLFIRKTTSVARAVDNVSIRIRKGETLGCVGGTGSGKSTLGRLLMRLIEPDSGEIFFDGECLTSLTSKSIRPLRRQMQIIFQDPLHSLNPRRTIYQNLEQPLLNFGFSKANSAERIGEMLVRVGIDPRHSFRYPHEYSGGQCQRIAIARAIVLQPRFLFLDEPVSALDVSIQAQILNLLRDLKSSLNLTYFFVSHDLKLVKQFADRIVVMYRGQVMEIGSSDDVYHDSKHPFTQDFLGTVLHLRKDRAWEEAAARATDVEEVTKAQRGAGLQQTGCVYADGCRHRFEPCIHVTPPLYELTPERRVACHLYAEGVAKNNGRVN